MIKSKFQQFSGTSIMSYIYKNVWKLILYIIYYSTLSFAVRLLFNWNQQFGLWYEV